MQRPGGAAGTGCCDSRRGRSGAKVRSVPAWPPRLLAPGRRNFPRVRAAAAPGPREGAAGAPCCPEAQRHAAAPQIRFFPPLLTPAQQVEDFTAPAQPRVPHPLLLLLTPSRVQVLITGPPVPNGSPWTERVKGREGLDSSWASQHVGKEQPGRRQERRRKNKRRGGSPPERL